MLQWDETVAGVIGIVLIVLGIGVTCYGVPVGAVIAGFGAMMASCAFLVR